MPNWVYNGLTIEGNPEQVKSLINQLNQPFKMVHDHWNMQTMAQEKKLTTYPNPIFAFWNIIKPTDLDAYWAPQVHEPDLAKAITFSSDHWYDWNVRNWGTKWDVGVSAEDEYPDTTIEEAENGENYVVHYNFNTAWSRPLPALFKLSEQYPDLLFTHSYEEETGWGGEMEILRGIPISESEYDNQCRDCDATNCMEFCEECENEICNVCNWLGEADLDSVATCQTHAVYLETKVPDYRKENI